MESLHSAGVDNAASKPFQDFGETVRGWPTTHGSHMVALTSRIILKDWLRS